MESSVTNVTNNHSIFICLLVTDKAKFTLTALPWISISNILDKRWYTAFCMICSLTQPTQEEVLRIGPNSK